MNSRQRSGVDNRSQPYGLGDQITACCLRIGRGRVKQTVTEMVWVATSRGFFVLGMDATDVSNHSAESALLHYEFDTPAS